MPHENQDGQNGFCEPAENQERHANDVENRDVVREKQRGTDKRDDHPDVGPRAH
jgi:hypothetical protein